MKRLTAILVLLSVATAHGELFDISAIINASQEIPVPSGVAESAGGFAQIQYDDISNELSWNIAWQDLTGDVVGMHFHAPAGVGASAGVALDIGNVSGLVSPSVGSMVISEQFETDLLAGESYINIHTEANGPGEIRGQVNPANTTLLATLDAAQEVPTPTGVSPDAGGMALLAFDPMTNQLGWNISWDNLSGPAVGMHFHGPAGVGETAGVKVNIGNISGLSSPSIGFTEVSDEFANQLLAGDWYINIHTEANGPGEIRGQVVPEPTSATLLLAGLCFAIGLLRRPQR